ncbi:hypothetical protein LJB42_004474 [Komagataella kurtzmanii]|nr:hypothetical protein LJB42_004474 [Komagataella kurtzmanii]
MPHKRTPSSNLLYARIPGISFENSPVFDFLSPFGPAPNQWVARYIIIIFAILIRLAVGLGSYSGFNTPPMYGDFEAQRHWMEITQHLSIDKWYFYDLQYWGLDYPPLTPFHSYFFGKLGSFINPSWFALDVSRGFESVDLKSYMRATAILSELLCFIPAVIWYCRWMGLNYFNQNAIEQTIIASAILFNPSLIIIDHGHFQYNSVMLGFALLSILNLLYDNFALAAIFFVLSISFKQMALYYSPIMFFYMLSVSCWPLKNFNLLRLATISIAVLFTFATLLLPFVLVDGMSQIGQILFRVFPFSRGLFEDKVANFWCTTNILVKYKQLFTDKTLTRISLVATLIAISPSCFIIFTHPKKVLLPWAFAACSWAFYLFSFQVHEKSVLVPLMPTTLLLVEKDLDIISMVCWISNIAFFSMWPLLKRDGLALEYFVLGILSNWLIGNLNWISKWLLPSFLIPGPTLSKKVPKRDTKTVVHTHWFWGSVTFVSYLGATVIQFLEWLYVPPAKYPDLWVILNTTLSFACFGLFWLWINYNLYILRDFKIKDA